MIVNSEVEFSSAMPRSSSANFLVLLLVKYCLDGSIGHDIFRWTNLDVKWSIDSLQC